MQCLGMATPLSKNESNEWSSDDTHRASFMYCSRTHSQVAQIKNGIVLTQNSLSTTHAWQYREVENDDCAFVKRFAIDLLRIYKNKINSQNSMMHVNQECRSLSSWKYRNYAKETMAIASKHQATMRMIHPATNLERDTTEAPQQQQQ
jgi:hypothetical protein